MSARFRITLAQLDPTVGDLAGNAARAREAHAAGAAAGADLVALPEMFLTGYQTQDLVLKPAFVADARRHMLALAEATREGPALAIGGPVREGEHLHNGYWFLAKGKVIRVVRKHHLPNYGVFDECRLFSPGPVEGPVAVGDLRIGAPICEDAWHPDVCEAQAESGAEVFLVPNGSPYWRGKHDLRVQLMVQRVIENELPLIYLNMVGGQDDQVFDGGSFALNPGGELALLLPQFEEAIAHLDLVHGPEGWRIETGPRATLPGEEEADYHAMVLGLRDYLAKSGLERVVLGLSGGIDSALVATIATDALGPERVRCVMLPSRYTSERSRADAEAVARALGCRLDEVPITEARAAVEATLAPLFAGRAPDVTEENIQARLRAVMLMALSNKFGEMLLTTGNKSEIAVGYATIYGDMAGGYNPIRDLYKTRVYRVARWRNANHRPWMAGPEGVVIPDSILTKAPSAELRPGQTDQDSLPPYEVLDDILEILIERDGSVAEAVAAGHDPATVRRVEAMIYRAEWKRRQAAPGVRLTPRAFGLDRRYPIVNRWRDPGEPVEE